MTHLYTNFDAFTCHWIDIIRREAKKNRRIFIWIFYWPFLWQWMYACEHSYMCDGWFEMGLFFSKLSPYILGLLLIFFCSRTNDLFFFIICWFVCVCVLCVLCLNYNAWHISIGLKWLIRMFVWRHTYIRPIATIAPAATTHFKKWHLFTIFFGHCIFLWKHTHTHTNALN